MSKALNSSGAVSETQWEPPVTFQKTHFKSYSSVIENNLLFHLQVRLMANINNTIKVL